MTVVCDHYQINIHELRTLSRKRIYALPRQVAIYFIREFEVLTWHTIKLYFRQNHATCIYAHHVVTNQINTDRAFSNEINEMKNQITEALGRDTIKREVNPVFEVIKPDIKESTNPIRIDWNLVSEQKKRDYEYKRHYMKDIAI